MAKEVAKTQEQAPAMWIPMDGLSDFDETDRQFPRIAIAQMMSSVVAEGIVKPGHWYNTLTNEDMGSEIKFSVIRFFKQRVWLAQGEGLKCRSLDGKVSFDGQICSECPRSKWADGKPAECSLTHNFLVILENDPIPYVLSFMRTSLPPTRKLIGLLNIEAARGGAIYVPMFSAKTKLIENKKGKYYVPDFNKIGQTPPELIQQAKQLRAALTRITLDVQHDEHKGDAAPF